MENRINEISKIIDLPNLKAFESLSENVKLCPNSNDRNTTLAIKLFVEEHVSIITKVSDSSGKLIYMGVNNGSYGQNNFIISSELWPAGTYSVSVKTPYSSTTKKLILKK